jgi:hypothetical protein
VLITLFASAVLAGPAEERIARDTVTLHDGGRVRRFAVARDEVGVIAADGRGQVRRLAPLADAEAVRQRARLEGGKADLIRISTATPTASSPSPSPPSATMASRLRATTPKPAPTSS